MAASKYITSSGTTVTLGSLLGKGGEGEVFDVAHDSTLAAKVFKSPPSSDRSSKLSSLVQLKTDRLVKLAAWPVDTIHERRGGPAVGFLMPKVSGTEQIHLLYTLKSRRSKFPEADWQFLATVAYNVAST